MVGDEESVMAHQDPSGSTVPEDPRERGKDRPGASTPTASDSGRPRTASIAVLSAASRSISDSDPKSKWRRR